MAVRALMILHHYPPDESIAALRARRLLPGLERRGIDATVLCRDSGLEPMTFEGTVHVRPVAGRDLGSMLRSKTPPGRDATTVDARDLAAETTGTSRHGRETHRLKWAKRFIRGWCLPDDAFSWIGGYAGAARADATEFDLIYSSSSPYSAHLAARRIARERRIPWVLELRDQWADNPYLPHRHNPITRGFQGRWETACLGEAARIVVTNDGHAARLAADRPDLVARIDVVPTGFETRSGGQRGAEIGAAPGSGTRSVPGTGMGTGGNTGAGAGAGTDMGAGTGTEPAPLRIVHAGNLYGGRNLSPVGRAIEVLSKAADPVLCRLVLIGSSFDLPWTAVAGTAERMEVRGRLSHVETSQLLDTCHLGIVHNPSFDRVHVPGKLFDYLGAGLPVLDLTSHPDVPRYCEGIVPCWRADVTQAQSVVAAIRAAADWWRGNPRPARPQEDHPLSSTSCADRLAESLLRAVGRL